MKKFVIRIFLFSSPFIMFVTSTLLFYNFSKLKVDLSFKNISSNESIILGDSQMQRLNEKFMDKRTKNISSAGEHYYFSYNKLFNLVKNKNHKIKNVILGVSVHNFSPVYNRLFNINSPEGKLSFKRYMKFITLFDDSGFIKSIGQLPLREFILGAYSSADLGGYYESNNSNPTTEIINQSYNMHFSMRKTSDKFSYSQRIYLYKIDSLCTSNNIDLTLISTPYHTEYKEKIETEYYDFFNETISVLNNRLHISFLSHKVDPGLMSDANHLNKMGSKIYSEMINQILDERVQNNSNKK